MISLPTPGGLPDLAWQVAKCVCLSGVEMLSKCCVFLYIKHTDDTHGDTRDDRASRTQALIMNGCCVNTIASVALYHILHMYHRQDITNDRMKQPSIASSSIALDLTPINISPMSNAWTALHIYYLRRDINYSWCKRSININIYTTEIPSLFTSRNICGTIQTNCCRYIFTSTKYLCTIDDNLTTRRFNNS